MTPAIDFRALFERSPNSYMLLDRELRYVAANPAYLQVTSTRLEDLLGRHLFEVFPHDPENPRNQNAALLKESLERVLATRAADTLAHIRYRVPVVRGGVRGLEERSWSATHTPLVDERGEVSFILQHTVDVTALAASAAGRTLAEASVLGHADQVEEERRHLRRLFEQAPGFTAFLRGPRHVFELANQAFEALVGDRPILGQPIAEAVPEVVQQGYVEILDRVFTSGASFVGRGVRALLRRQRGGPLEEVFLDFVYQPILDSAGKVTGIFVQGQDLTEQRRLEAEREALLVRERSSREEAQAAEQRQRFLAESIPQQVWTADPAGALDFVSSRVLSYFATTSEQMLGAGWQAVIHAEDLPACLERWGHSLATGEEYEVEFRLRRYDGAYRWHLGRAVALRAPSGEVLKWFGTNTDIDEARRSNDELRRIAAHEQQLIGIVSHDLRNPLNAIGMSASLLMRRGGLDDQQGKAIGRIISSAERASRLIRDFLDFAQARNRRHFPIHPVPTRLVDLARLVVDEVHLSYPERVVTVEQHGDTEGEWDVDRISQVIANLVGNAFQHSPPEATVHVASHGKRDEVRLEVHNEGPAIPPQDLEHLFEPFQRGNGSRPTAGHSVGLGLYIAREIVLAHRGSIEVDSGEGRGTRFSVRLPRHAAVKPPRVTAPSHLDS